MYKSIKFEIWFIYHFKLKESNAEDQGHHHKLHEYHRFEDFIQFISQLDDFLVTIHKIKFISAMESRRISKWAQMYKQHPRKIKSAVAWS